MSANRKRGVLILIIGVLIILVSTLLPIGSGKLHDNNQIERLEFGQGDNEISLIAISELGETVIDYSVAERQYTSEEIQGLLSEFLEELESNVLGESEAADRVEGALNFVEEIEGYPFYITWSTDRSDLVGSGGNIKVEITEDTPVMLNAEIEYGDWIYEHSFAVVLVPQEYTPLENWRRRLEDALVRADAESSSQNYMTLPAGVDGIAVKWNERADNKGAKIGGFCIVIAIIFFYSDVIEKKEMAKKRLQEIKSAYPEFVLKCAMLIGAGMTIKQTFERLGKTYQQGFKEKNALYEELLIGVRELENGIAERLVYENFGRRCGIRETEKFGNMLSGNLRKGSDGLKSALREEACEAMELQKEQIKKKGETAGTKLLFPMLILLLIVMVIIMVPAFSTFSI